MLKQLIATMPLLLSISAQAAIVDMGSVTRDTSTGLDWLDVTFTAGMSYNQVAAELGPGGNYEGWRYASVAELDQLIINFGYVAVNTNCSGEGLHCDSHLKDNSPLITTMIKTLGDTYDAHLDRTQAQYDAAPDGAGYTYGFLGSPSAADFYPVAMIYDGDLINRSTGIYLGDEDDQVKSHSHWERDYFALDSLGSFLVAPSQVPIPASGWLFISALLCLTAKYKGSRH